MKRIISRTPVRISFFGGGTDYPAYYFRHPGAILGTTINQYTYVSMNARSSFFDHTVRISYSKIELVKCLEEIEHPSVRACLAHKQIFSPLDIDISSDLPAKTGLGSSSSFTVGFLNALYALQGKKIPKQSLAEEACHIEQIVIGENVGSQDQYHAAYGGFNIIEFSSAGTIVRPLITTLEKKRLFESHLLVLYTGLTRFANDVAKEQIEKTKQCNNDSYLQRMYETVFEAEKIFSDASPSSLLPRLGALLNEGWYLKKQLSSKVSNPFIDECYRTALANGAFGGKLCGAGSGGFLALLIPPERREQCKAALHLPEVACCFENEGSTIIYMHD